MISQLMFKNTNLTILKRVLDTKILTWTTRKPTNVQVPKFDHY
jgi:hypothetical protein